MEKIISPLLRGLNEKELQDMMDIHFSRKQTYEKNAIIFSAGSIIHEIGIVLSGSVNIENNDLWGNKSILSNVPAGQVFAETYAFSHEPMMVDAVAAEDCTILFLDFNMLMDNPLENRTWQNKIIKNMLNVSMQKNLALSSRIFCTSSKTIRGRLLTYLSSQSMKAGSTTFDIPFNRQQLADYLNTDRSALSNELGKMRDDGLIEFYKNTFRLKAVPQALS
ncbi:Crp/Fnr family transcriptional regulator [Agathobacter sp.]